MVGLIIGGVILSGACAGIFFGSKKKEREFAERVTNIIQTVDKGCCSEELSAIEKDIFRALNDLETEPISKSDMEMIKKRILDSAARVDCCDTSQEWTEGLIKKTIEKSINEGRFSYVTALLLQINDEVHWNTSTRRDIYLSSAEKYDLITDELVKKAEHYYGDLWEEVFCG